MNYIFYLKKNMPQLTTKTCLVPLIDNKLKWILTDGTPKRIMVF